MKHLLAVSLSLVACAAPPGPHTGAADTAFPDAWVGRWAGDLHLFDAGGVRRSLTMELEGTRNADPARFGWTIVYHGSEGRQERRYHLLVRDAARGEFAIDENNGIVLDARMLGGTLYSWFDVGGTRLLARERLVGAGTPQAAIDYEIVTASEAAVERTGAGGAVTCYPPRTLQRARLRRVR